jgi:hypothetical protein
MAKVMYGIVASACMVAILMAIPINACSSLRFNFICNQDQHDEQPQSTPQAGSGDTGSAGQPSSQDQQQ